MRTIKFRVWHNTQNYFLDDISKGKGLLFFHVEPKETFSLSLDLLMQPNNPYKVTVQQFTGLKDKNGKEVYEGDILTGPHSFDSADHKGQVYYAAGAFFIDGDGPLCDHVHSLTPDILTDYVVAGNVFENEELLK